MTPTGFQKHRVYTKTQVFDFAADPVSTFGAISDEGRCPHRILLESADIITRKGEKSLIVASAALKATCRGLDVLLEALTDNGKHALKMISENLFPNVIDVGENFVRMRFKKADSKQDLQARLLCSSSLDVLRVMTHAFERETNVLPEHFLVAGIFAYDAVDQFEELPKAKEDALECPDFVFWLPERLVIIDHRLQTTHVIQHVFDKALLGGDELEALAAKILPIDRHCERRRSNPEKNPPTPFDKGGFKSDVSDAEFAEMALEAKKRIVAGDVFQIVPSRTFKMRCVSSFAAYQQLRLLNPSPYMYYVNDADFTLLGASPETFIKVSRRGRFVEVRPIAGTRPRGIGADGQIDPELDMRLEAELKLDEKELAEHFMLVDLARNDVARVSKPKTRQVSRLLCVDRYSHVMHLVSCVQGELKEDLDALHAYQASANMGTLVGAPKVKAAQILREIEKTKRGFYGGAVGYLDQSGNMDTAIIIRSALVKKNIAYVRAGAGVVYDSNPKAEVAESHNKAKAVLKAIAMGNEDVAI